MTERRNPKLVTSGELSEQLEAIKAREDRGPDHDRPLDVRVVRCRTPSGAFVVVGAPVDRSSRCGKLLVFAHGCRPVGLGLAADMTFTENALDGLYLALICSGWCVGMSSYRKEGVCVADGAHDTAEVRKVAEDAGLGPFSLAIVEGESMGGLIATIIAEGFVKPQPFDAVLTCCAALLTSESGIELTRKPVVPIIHLTTTDELTPLQEWADAAKANAPSVPSALWFVRRNGHCNCSASERGAALCALVDFALGGARFAELHDATVVPPEMPPSADFDDRGAWVRVTQVNVYGDIATQLRPQDMAKLGIRLGSTFLVAFHRTRFPLGDASDEAEPCKMKYGATDFMSTDVQKGGFYASDTADGFIQMSGNGLVSVNKLSEKVGACVGSWIHVLRPVGIGAGLLGIPGGVDAHGH